MSSLHFESIPMKARQKVFGIGFQKTGTSSLGEALETLGYKVIDYYSNDITYDELRESYVDRGLELAEEYDAVQDMPWPLIFKQLDQRFPGSKFILTVRSSENWYSSMVKHFGTKETPMRQLTYGKDAPAPVGNKQRYINVFDTHNRGVIEYFSARPDDLLILDLEKGEGWAELGRFLNRSDVPQGSFVHANKAEVRDSINYRLRRRLNQARVKLGMKPRM